MPKGPPGELLPSPFLLWASHVSGREETHTRKPTPKINHGAKL